ncbi:hypothetical protein ACS0TY_028828 [Phlomoides rotata]
MLSALFMFLVGDVFHLNVWLRHDDGVGELSLSLVQLYMMSHERAASSDKTEIRCLLKSPSQSESYLFPGKITFPEA